MTTTKPPVTDFFTKELALAYDERNSKLAAISENMHFLIRLILKDLPKQSNILCVGVGTGAEVLSLANTFPEWTFTCVEPSASMLDVCKQRLEKAGTLNRCQLINGYVNDVPIGENFNAALSVLVAHFVKRDDRSSFFQNMSSRLKKDGYLVNTEISFDLASEKFPSMLTQWEKIQSLMGATPESLAMLPKTLKENLTVLPPTEKEGFIQKSGIRSAVRVFQSFMITGWYGQK